MTHMLFDFDCYSDMLLAISHRYDLWMLTCHYLFCSQDISKCCELVDRADNHSAVVMIEGSRSHDSAEGMGIVFWGWDLGSKVRLVI
jgi:hypothetical protein